MPKPRTSSTARPILGALLALGAAAAVTVAAASMLKGRKPDPAPTTGTKPAGPAGTIPGSADGRQLESGVSTAWPTTSLVDTGPADWSHNPAGWDYVPIVKDWRL